MSSSVTTNSKNFSQERNVTVKLSVVVIYNSNLKTYSVKMMKATLTGVLLNLQDLWKYKINI